MASCPKCSAAVPDGGRFCSTCGSPIGASPFSLTETSTPSNLPTAAAAPEYGRDAITSHPSLARSRFVPGSILDKRYRIVGLLGRGGMGEVYRADDLRLGQPVALKFLPEGLERDGQRLNRFLNEVRTARQVTHSNVCRVYDIDEVDGQHYLSMEYVDGEDLSSLLRRIGRLPKDKATQIARQLCAGIRAAHEQGILHRDLKPANVMIDGRGQVKITDFGLAVLEETIQDGEIRSGTPAYMAPEQLAGKEVTVKSEIYSLGLVLYELFTGKPAFEASSLTEMERLHSDVTPSSPSSHVEGFDPTVEKAILRCLEKEPGERPASVLAVAAALPGGDPLVAALAAGETPSPEMVADAGHVGRLRPRVAVTILVLALVGLLAIAWAQDRVSLLGQLATEKSPELLAADARAIVRLAGDDTEPVDTVIGFVADREYLMYRQAHGVTEDVAGVEPSPLQFWFRQSPQHLVVTPHAPNGPVTWSDPPLGIPGEVLVRLDLRGRLVVFQSMPPLWADDDEPAPRPDWSSLFASAGLAMETFRPVPPRWNPPQGAEDRRAWEGAYPDRSESAIRVEAGSLRGRPLYFGVFPAWADQDPAVATRSVRRFFIPFLLLLTLLGSGLLARRNLRLGRANRRGAFRLAVVLLVLQMLYWGLWTNHVPGASEIMHVFIPAAGIALFLSLLGYVAWLAAEPHLRRLWPELLISWTRLLGGRLRDPMVGRDLPVGASFGILISFLTTYAAWADDSIRYSRAFEDYGFELVGVRFALAAVVFSIFSNLFFPLLVTTVLLILRILLRQRWLAGLAWVAFLSVALGLTQPGLVAKSLAVATAALLLFVLVRFGLLALCASTLFLATNFTPTLDASRWYFLNSAMIMSILVGIAVYGCYTSLGGRSVFSEQFLDVKPPSTT